MITDNQHRKSKQREKILELLQGTQIHPTANWIYDQMKQEFPNLSLGTVYRNLNILVEQNKVKKIIAGSTFDRFEANLGEHCHMICEKCGVITDFEIGIDSSLISQVEENLECKIRHHKFDFFGICKKCRNQ
ncbi:MAG: transcriptional repressor [Candidatus Marinimicrobia bacterium]|nr:transcriptional repressor [Candidatus Neomarinimicrobiota bacterium]